MRQFGRVRLAASWEDLLDWNGLFSSVPVPWSLGAFGCLAFAVARRGFRSAVREHLRSPKVFEPAWSANTFNELEIADQTGIMCKLVSSEWTGVRNTV